jgi:hypothetical protein
MRTRYTGIVFDSARWDHFTPRPGDIVITTPPKCGTTWTQMICALLVFQTPDLPDSLDKLSPWLDMLTRPIDSVVADLDAQQHRRFIKSHSPYDALPIDANVTYICVGRDLRDVFLSWDHHIENQDFLALITARQNAVGLDDVADQLAEGPPVRPERLDDRFWAWVEDERPITEWISLHSSIHHLESFWEHRDDRNVVMLHYDDLLDDLDGEMRALAARLGIEVPDDRWPQLVAAASFDQMRDRADVLAPDTTNAIWHSNRSFFNRGTRGQWREQLGPEADSDRYWNRVNGLACPDVVEWTHRT